ncbi:MAG: hypothetical protein ACKVP2_15915 [Burkholderiales bacterium]
MPPMKTAIALDHLLCAVGDPLVDLSGIAPGDAEYSRALLIRIAAGIIAKDPDGHAAIRRSIEAFPLADLTKPNAMHLAAANAWLSGDPARAAQIYESILHHWPHDLLALRLAQSCYFFLGWQDRLCSTNEAILNAWQRDDHNFRFVLAFASFAYAENGHTDMAERLGREGLAIEPACPFAVHAVTHAIAENSQPRAGAQWMRNQVGHWAGESRMRAHNAWHLAMFDVTDGNVASALGILDGWLLPASMTSSLDSCDATSLLWSLAAEGLDVSERWQRLSNAFARTLTPGFWPYVDLHAAIAHWKAGHHDRFGKLLRAIESRAAGDDFAASRARSLTLPGLLAIQSLARCRPHEAAAHLNALRPALGLIGGSRLQLEIFRNLENEIPGASSAAGSTQLVRLSGATPLVHALERLSTATPTLIPA